MYFFKNAGGNWILGENVNSLSSGGYTSLIVHNSESVSFAKDLDNPLVSFDILNTKKNELDEYYLDLNEFVTIASDFFVKASGDGGVQTVTGDAVDNSDPNNPVISSTGSAPIDSVFGRTGIITSETGDYTKEQVGLGNVDNTSDLNKPISNSTQTALDGKVNGTFIKETVSGDDAGIVVVEQLSVGTWDAPKESVFGQGDSTTDTMRVFQTPDDTNFTDITNTASSDTGSTFALFNGTTTGNYTYIGSDFKFSGLKAKINTNGLVEADNVTVEFWDGTQWQVVKTMVTSANPPLLSYGNMVAQNGNMSEQWRFNFDPYGQFPEWMTNSVNGVTKYWVRYGLIGTISTDPILEQFKLHTSRFEINATGETEYFGYARYKKELISGINILLNNNNQSPANEIISYSPDVSINQADNEFIGNAIDSRCFVLNNNEGIDTSIPVEVIVSYYVKGTGIGDFELSLSKIDVLDDFVYDGTAVETGEVLKVDSITTPTNLVRRSMTLYLDISDGDPKSGYLVILRRDASAANSNDTLANNIVLTHLVVNGYFWKA